jgi:hypothetical protein
MLVAGRDIRVLSEDGALLRQLTLDPSKDYQARGSREGVHYAPRHLSTMSRDITQGGSPGNRTLNLRIKSSSPTDRTRRKRS